MTLIYHAQTPADHAAMDAIRAAIAASGELSATPAMRPNFDALVSRTPHAVGVSYEADCIGGVPGWWCRPAGATSDGVILYHHGGAYVLGSADAYRRLAGQIAARAGVPAFVADYRLAPERPFPAATDDALAAYRGLAALGHRIVLAGDSAGGGLSLSLLRHASETSDLPAPLGALAISPWTDLALTGGSFETHASVDPMLTRSALAAAAELYLGDRDRSIPEASPLYGDLGGLPPVLIHVGESEILLDDSRRYVSRVNDAGGSALVHVWEGMLHVFPANLEILQAAEEALDISGKFLASLLKG